MSKKMRGPNFSTNEKEIVIHLVTKNKDVVENKKTDAVTTAMKNEGWRKITEEFNSLSSFCVRNTDQLKTCWDNIKRTTRKDKAHTKKELFLTGGGKEDDQKPGPFQGQVETILGPTLDGLQNDFDSDAHFKVNTENEINIPLNEVTITEIEPLTITMEEVSGPSVCQNDLMIESEKDEKVWNGWSPAALKRKVSDNLSTNKKNNSPWLCRRRPKLSLQDKLLESKLELIEITKKNAASEAELKIKILEEQLKSAELEAELKIQILREQLRQEKLKTDQLEHSVMKK